MSHPSEEGGWVPEEAGRSQRGFGSTVGFTVLGAVVPGTAFLAAGRRKLGTAILVLFLLLVGAGIWLATSGRHVAARIAVERSQLLYVMGGVALIAVLWLVVIVVGYRMLLPARTTGLQHVLGGLLVLVLAAVVVLPGVEAIHLAAVQRGLIAGVFAEHQKSATVVEKANPFAGKPRVNVLLLGGDSGPGREGVRTDSVIVASIDTRTGSTLLFSLPRNLENLPFPPGSPLAKIYPHGFQSGNESDSLLNAVYQNGPRDHPDALGPTDNPGGDFVKLGVGQALGLHIDYFVMVNMDGFAKIVDILGGITVNTNYWVPINGDQSTGQLPDDYFAPGPNQHLDGWHALQWSRGRFGLNDYLRMDRQRCAIDAMISSANPSKVLRQYQQLAATTQDIVTTDIPQSALDDFVDLAFKIKGAQVRSVVFDENLIKPAYPNYDLMRQIVQNAISPGSSAAPTTSTAPTTSAAPASPAGPSSTAQPTAASPVANIHDVCAYDPAQAQAALAAGKPPTRRG